MDPLTAFSLAGTIIQFVDFSNRLLTSDIQLYKSSRGSLRVNEELELVTGDLQSVVLKLRGNFSINHTGAVPLLAGNNEPQEGFVKICDEASRIAIELLRKLNGLKAEDRKLRAWESLKAAVRSAWSRDEINSLKNCLIFLKQSLDSRSTLLLG